MSITKRDIQLCEKKILDEFHRVCKENNIKYYLAQGSLIGAVRHKGFIPWDDDIDLIINYKELNKILQIFPEEGDKKYSITHFTNEKHNPLTWAKIRDNGTLSRPYRYKELPINWGICIDIFPYYPCSSNKYLRSFEVFLFKVARKMNFAGMTKYEEGHGFFVRILEKIPISVRHFFIKFAFKIFSLHKDDSEYVCVLSKGSKLVKRSYIEGEEKELEFEGDMYPVPSNYHEYLTKMYGDYMTLPPEDEKGGHDLFMGEIEWKI